MTSTCSVARLIARWKRRRSSFKRSAVWDTGVAGSMPSSIKSMRSSWRSSVPVSLSVGQDSSCTPLTTTRRNSRPAAPWAVNSGTASGTAVRRSRTPVGSSCSSIWAIKESIVAVGRRSVKSPAASNKDIMESKSRSACEPAAPPRKAIAIRESASFVADHTAQRTSSTLPPASSSARPDSSTPRIRVRMSSSRSVSIEPKSGSSPRWLSSSPKVTSARVSGFQRRSPRSRRRSVTGSVPPTGPSSSSRHWAIVSSCSCAFKARSPSSMAVTIFCSLSTTSVGLTATGTPACSNERRSGSIIPAERTITAISRHGTPSLRWDRRSISTTVAWLRVSVGATATVTAGSRRLAPRSIVFTSLPYVARISRSRWAKNSGDAPRKRKTD